MAVRRIGVLLLLQFLMIPMFAATRTWSGSVTGNDVTLTVVETTATSVNSSMNPSLSGQEVTFTALVTSVAGGMTGTVTFTDGGNVLGTAPVQPSPIIFDPFIGAGEAKFKTAQLTPGPHQIVASYSGDGGFAASASAILVQNVSTASIPTLAHGTLILLALAMAATGLVLIRK
jgi:hypothetical protein